MSKEEAIKYIISNKSWWWRKKLKEEYDGEKEGEGSPDWAG